MEEIVLHRPHTMPAEARGLVGVFLRVLERSRECDFTLYCWLFGRTTSECLGREKLVVRYPCTPHRIVVLCKNTPAHDPALLWPSSREHTNRGQRRSATTCENQMIVQRMKMV